MRKRITGLILIGTMLVALGFWEFWGRKNIGYDEILTVRADAAANTIISPEMLTTKMVENAPKESLRKGDDEKVIGLECRQFIPKGETLYVAYFEESRFRVGEETGNLDRLGGLAVIGGRDYKAYQTQQAAEG